MKFTNQQINKIIEEEIKNVLSEAFNFTKIDDAIKTAKKAGKQSDILKALKTVDYKTIQKMTPADAQKLAKRFTDNGLKVPRAVQNRIKPKPKKKPTTKTQQQLKKKQAEAALKLIDQKTYKPKGNVWGGKHNYTYEKWFQLLDAQTIGNKTFPALRPRVLAALMQGKTMPYVSKMVQKELVARSIYNVVPKTMQPGKPGWKKWLLGAFGVATVGALGYGAARLIDWDGNPEKLPAPGGSPAPAEAPESDPAPGSTPDPTPGSTPSPGPGGGGDKNCPYKARRGDRAAFDKFYALLDKHGLKDQPEATGRRKRQGKSGRDYRWGSRHDTACKLLMQAEQQPGAADQPGQQTYIPNLSPPPKAVRYTSENPRIDKEGKPALQEKQGPGALGSRENPAKGTRWRMLYDAQKKQAMATRQMFGITTEPKPKDIVIIDPEFIQYFGLTFGEANKAYKTNQTLAPDYEGSYTAPAAAPAAAGVGSGVTAAAGQAASKAPAATQLAKPQAKAVAMADQAIAKAAQSEETGGRKPSDRRILIAREDAETIFRLAKGYTDPEDEDKIRALVLKHLKGNNIELLHNMYLRVLTLNDELERGDLVAELRNEDLFKLANDVFKALVRQGLEGEDFASPRGGALRESLTPTSLKILVKKHLKKRLK